MDGIADGEGAGGDLDPQIRAFVRRMGEAFAAHPSLSDASPEEARRIAERARGPFTHGGPEMAAVRELMIPAGGRDVRVRLYDPGGPGPKPALVYLHGGGWTMFSLETHDRLMREYAGRAGVVVAGVDYALSPEARFPQALEEVVDVVRWLQRDGAGAGVAPDRLALGGDSAGANLAISAAGVLKAAGEAAALNGLVLNYGVYGTDFDTSSHRRYRGPEYMLTSNEMEGFWTRYIRSQADLSDPRAVPLKADLSGLPAVFMAIAECDVLFDENQAMAAALRAARVPVEARIYKGATHSFLEAVSMADVADRALGEASAWLAGRLAPGVA
ncbi:MAG: alpha/beta hydrolase fold domain-containing protein [Alphaproteobacteria bacterium]|nr:alpha/beta hydrolase fold domain-containing protein [Alphaproteobacteria bacterium]